MRSILLSILSENGRGVVDGTLDGLLRLLRQGGSTRCVGLVPNAESAGRAHLDMSFLEDDALAGAIAGFDVLCVSGDLTGRRNLERAARHLCLAKLAGVRTALVSVRVPQPTDTSCAALLEELLIQADSMSASDAKSAARLGRLCGRRVETTAPTQLLLEIPKATRADRMSLAVLPQLFENSSQEEKATLESAFRDLVIRRGARVVLLGTTPRGFSFPFEACPTNSWKEWARVVTECDVVVSRGHSPLLGLAMACGTAPVLVGTEGCELHERVGLLGLVLPFPNKAKRLIRVLEAASRIGTDELRARTAPLRALCWRALGPLADSLGCKSLVVRAYDPICRAVVGASCTEMARPLLEAGDAVRAETLLDPWRSLLQDDPAVTEAWARVWSLQGRDADACRVLEEFLARHPENLGCRIALARVYMQRGDMDAARLAWKRVEKHDPSCAEASYELGCLALIAGSIPNALDHWAQAQIREPGSKASAEAARATGQAKT